MMASKISMPTWMPEPVGDLIWELEQTDLSPEQHAILRRMSSDIRMKNVLGVLFSRNRKTGAFAHPAVQPEGDRFRSGDDLQFAAIRQICHFVFTAARDRMMVTKVEEVFQNKKRLLENAALLRSLANDLDLARARNQFGVSDPDSKALAARDVAALRNVANWLEGLTTATRGPGDPLIVRKHRGDRVARGVQILTAMKLKELFGKQMDGTAATLAGVALGSKTSARVSRSALSKPKSPKKSVSKRL
jgi:hypothetical protein